MQSDHGNMKTMKTTVLASMVLSATLLVTPLLHLAQLTSTAPVEPSVPPTFGDVAYGQFPKQVLTFRQAKSDQPTPWLFHIHGGVWTNRQRIFGLVTVPGFVQDMLNHGISAVSAGYRFLDEGTADVLNPLVKGPMLGCECALQFVRSKAKEWHLDKAFHKDLADPTVGYLVARESTRPLCGTVQHPQTRLDPQQTRGWIPNCDYGGIAFGINADSAKNLSSFEVFLAGREKLLPLFNEYSPYALVTRDSTADKMIFNARDYGAKGDGVANDSEAIQLAIEAAIRAGAGSTVSIPAGHYYLGPVRDGRDKWSYFRIDGNPDHLTIKGAGANKTVFLTSGASQPFVVRSASNLVIRGFSVDWKTLNLTQGVVTAVDPENGTYQVAMDEGYAAPNAEIFQANDRYKPELRVLSPGRNTFGWRESEKIESVEAKGSNWVFHVSKTDPNGSQGKTRLAQVGRRFFVWGRQRDGNGWTPLVSIAGAHNLTIENVNDYAGGGFQGGEDSTGTLTFNDYNCGPPAGSNRLGFYGGHQGHSRAAVVMNDCNWIMSNDDQVNALTGLDYIYAQTSPNTVTLRRNSDYQVGDKISIWDYSDPDGIKVSATANVTAIAPLPGDEISVVLDRDVVVKKLGRPGDESGDDRMKSGRDRLVNLSSSGPWTMTHCSFNSSFAHPLLIKAYNGITMTNCEIYGSDMSGLESGMISYWNEGPQTRNVTLRRNTFYDNDGVAVLINIGALGGNSTASHDQGDIVIENNLFVAGGRLPVWNNVNPRGVALMVGNSSHAVVANNVFSGFPNSNIAVYASDDVQIKNNVFLKANERGVDSNNRPARENFNERTVVWINNSRNVALSGNLSYLTGANNQALAAVGATNVFDVRGLESGIKKGEATTFDLEKAPAVNGWRAVAMNAPRAGSYRIALFYSRTSPNNAPPFTLPVAKGKVVVNGHDAGAITFQNDGVNSSATPDLVVMVPIALKAGRNTVSFDAGDKNVTLHQAALLLP